jgi:vacuolar protein 8
MRSNIAGTREPLLRETERDAVSSLLQYLEQDATNSYRSISDDKLRDLCTLAYSDNVDLQRSAALCFSELSEKLTEPISESQLEPLIHLLLSSDIEVQKASSLAISNLALHGPPENKQTIVQARALQPLISLLSSDSTEVQCNACGCITTLATTEANKIEIVEYGAIGPLLALTRVNDSRVQRNTTGALLNLTHIESNREKLVQAGGVAVFVHLLDSKDADVQFYCAAALSNLAVHDAHRSAIMAVGNGRVIPSLVTTMGSTVEKVRCQGCLAIRNLASDDVNQGKIVQSGGLHVLIPLLTSTDTETVTAAVAALRNLSIHKGNENLIIQSGALPELKRLLMMKDFPEIQCHAAGTLRNLAAEDQSQAVIDEGCLPALADQLQNYEGVPEMVLSEVSAALAVLAANEMARAQIMSLYDGEFYKTLIEWTDSQYSEVQYNCAGVIGHLAINTEYHSRLLGNSPSALGVIHRFMESEEQSCVHIALWITAQFSHGDTTTRTQLRQPSLLNKVQHLRTSQRNSDDIRQLAESTFGNITANQDPA